MAYGMVAGIAGLGLAGVLGMGGLCGPEMMKSHMSTMHGTRGMMGMEMPSGGTAAAQAIEALPAEATKVATIKVEGMTCGGCAVGVRTALKRLDGVAEAQVSYEDERAVVTFDPARVSTDRMLEAIREFGYTATLASVEDRA